MAMYNLVEYSKNYSKKKSGSLWQYNRDKPVLNNTDSIINFLDDNNSAPFKFKQK